MANDGTLIFNRSDDVDSLALGGAISGSGNLIQRGTGTTTLSGVNTYSGGTTIENGTVAINSDAALGAATGDLAFGTSTTGGTLKLLNDIDDLADSRTVTINAGGGTIDTGSNHGTTDADMTGDGALTKTGSGTLTLTGANTYAGGTTVKNGELELGDGGTTGSVSGDVAVEEDGTGTNSFEEGIDLYDGRIVLKGQTSEASRLGIYDGQSNAGLVTFKDPQYLLEVPNARIVEVAGQNQTLQNRFVVESGVNNNQIVANGVTATISGITSETAITLQDGANLVLEARGDGNIILEGNRSDISIGGNSSNLTVDGTGNTFIKSGMTGQTATDGSGSWLGKSGTGTLQIEADSHVDHVWIDNDVDGIVELWGTGTAKNGFLQIAADSSAYVTNVQSGRLRLVDEALFDHVRRFTLILGASLEGNGTIRTGNSTNLYGIVSPDSAVFTSGTDTVRAAEKIGALQILGGDTRLANFTFQYDVVAANTNKDPNDTLNDLIQFGSQVVTIGSGTVNFRTASGSGSLDTGHYLVFDSTAAQFRNDEGTNLDDTRLNTVLKGQINGDAFETFGPRNLYDFYFDNQDGFAARSQVWLDVSLNSLTMDWTGGSATWNATASTFTSLQTSADGNTREHVFRDGDFVYFMNSNAATPVTVTLNDDVTISGMVGGSNSAGAAGATGEVIIAGTGGITARLPKTDGTETDIVGKFIGNTLKPTGKLEMRGPGTLTLANTGKNEFQEGIDVYEGSIELAGENRLGVYDPATTGFANAGLVTFKNSVGGGADDLVARYIDVTAEQVLKNRFVVEDYVKAAYFRAFADTTVSGVTGDANSGAFRVGVESKLSIVAMDGDITMTGNQTSGGTKNDVSLASRAVVEFQSGDGIDAHHIFIDSGIAGFGKVQKSGTGILQIAADSAFWGSTEIQEGTFRVVGDRDLPGSVVTYGVAIPSVFNTNPQNAPVTIAGGGIIAGEALTIGSAFEKVYVSPDSARLSSGDTDISDAKKYGTLMLQGGEASLAFHSRIDMTPGVNDRTGFHFDYDVFASNTLPNGDRDLAAATNTQNDLLQITGRRDVRLEGGVVNFRTGADGLGSGSYLIIDSDVTIADMNGFRFVTTPTAGRNVLDGINNYETNKGVLWGKINDEDIRVGSPRRHLEFVLREGLAVDSQIWLDVQRNTLTMVRTVGGDWNTAEADELWKSLQSNNVNGTDEYDYVIYRGDYAKIYNENAASFTVTGDTDQILSGLQLGNVGDSGDVIIAGAFGVTAVTVDDWIEGIYLAGTPAPGTPLVPVDGKLTKRGGNTATFTNTGTNTFEQGVELYGGILSYNNANQLLVGTDKAITFKADAVLRSDAVADQDTAVSIDTGVTGTLHADYGNAMLLQESVSGNGNLTKTGDGIVQLGVDSTIGGNASVDNGAFRVVDGTGFTANTVTVASGSSLQGGGTVAGGTITINGNISPDKATLTTANLTVPDVNKFATLKLVGIVMQPKVPVDGKLTKTGTGTATFANTGTNTFSEGIELYNGILSYNNANQLLVGDGKSLTFKGDSTLRADATADLNTDVTVENGKTGTLHADDGIAMLLQKAISGGGNLVKTGNGVVQLGVTSAIGGHADVENGAFRVVKNTTFTAATVGVKTGASFQGCGSLVGSTILVNGNISPDNAILTTANIVVSDAEKFGTLTLNGNVTLDGFTFDYDLGTAYTGADPSHDPTGDLLKIVGGVDLAIGHVAFQGEFESGKYLIVDADSVIDVHGQTLDGINSIDGILTASLNGNILTSETPRHELLFRFEDGQKQIWLDTEINSLFVDWTGGEASWGSSAWTSRQQTLSGGRDNTFRSGDRVAFLDGTQDSRAMLVSNVIVGGLDVNTAKNVTIDGDFQIRATKNDPSMIGKFVKTDGSADPAQQQFNTTGELRKEGGGILTFRNKANTFEEGIFLGGGTTAFDKAVQLGDGGKGIEFFRNSTLRPDVSLELGNAIRVNDNVTATFETADDITLDYIGDMSGSINSAMDKTGYGTMNLNADSTAYLGMIDVKAGTLGVYANYGGATGLVVRDGATLTGYGPNAVIGSGLTGTIQSGGTLAPRGMSSFVVGAIPTAEYLIFKGDLHFENGSVYDVMIAQYDGGEEKLTPVSDCVYVVGGGTVTIDGGALLNVNYWDTSKLDTYNEEQSSKFTIIDATDGETSDGTAEFDLTPETVVPRGVKLIQGWQYYDAGWRDHAPGWLYQLWFEDDPNNNFENLCDRHNRVEIGKNLDQLVDARDPGLMDLINHLSAPCFSDPEVCELLDQITGDLRANSLMMAMKTPWRSPFSRLGDLCATGCGDPCSPVGIKSHKYQLWGEWFGRYDDVRSDGNAHGFTINRMGVTVGADRRLTQRTTLGLAFNYTDPRLRQATGKVEMDDYEIGLYGRTCFNNDWMLKYYAGYSHQRYDLDRWVYIPECNQFPALSERFRNSVDGDALAMSFELTRAFQVRKGIRLLPLIAFDFNQAWQKGYRETGGLTALEYDKTSLERIMLRFGLNGEFAVRNNLDLKARIQYATQLNSHEQARSGTRFANATIADQRSADIWGVKIGRDSLNLGIGMDWKPSRLRATTIFVNYDADLYRKATIHAGEFGAAKRW